jgi:hypothetical protein
MTTKQTRLAKELFEMVFTWGQWNVRMDGEKLNYRCPAFQSAVKELLATKKIKKV